MHFEDARLAVEFAYDALGRRMFKHSSAHYKARREAGSQWNRNEHERKQRELGCGFTLYGWDGDNLAWESRPAQYEGDTGRTMHYLFEPGGYVPVVQAVRNEGIRLIAQPTYRLPYNIDDDPVWTFVPQAKPFTALAWYQCDHLGTPQELPITLAKWRGRHSTGRDARACQGDAYALTSVSLRPCATSC